MGALMRNGIGYSNNDTGVLMRNGINYTGKYSGGGGGDYQSLDLDLIANTYIDGNGVEQTYNGWSSTDYLDIDGQSTIFVCGTTGQYNAWYDSSKQFIQSVTVGAGVLAVPSGAKYIRISDNTATMANVYVFDEV